MKKNIRIILGVLIVLLTIVEVVYYLSKHTYLLAQLGQTSLGVILGVLLLYGVMVGALVLILYTSLRMCHVVMSVQDNFLLNAYSLFVNFFIIGQAGPGVRAAYLKKYYNLLIRRYIYVTLLYYVCYALVSALLMLAGSTVPWPLTIVAAVLLGMLGYIAITLYTKRKKMSSDGLNLSVANLSYLMLATIFQAIIQIAIYFIELHSVNGHITLKQTLAYTGVANFALFVGLTPGAIGIRETFLVFSERLHHISSANIVAANIIDRSVYLLFLGILFIVIATTHVKRRFSTEVIE